MSFPSLWSSLIILPAVHVPRMKRQTAPTAWDLDPNLPAWERHPMRKPGPETGSLDADWIRRHLP